MPVDRKDLARRVGAASAEETTRGLNFNTVFALVEDRLGAAVAKQIDPQGKGRRVDFFSYPIAEYLPITWEAIDRLEPSLGGVDAAFRELGRRTVSGFLASLLGKTAFAMAGRDPRRVLASGPSGYRAAVGYGERRVEFLGERRARMVFVRDFMPALFHATVLETALAATDAKAVRVEPRDTDFPAPSTTSAGSRRQRPTRPWRAATGRHVRWRAGAPARALRWRVGEPVRSATRPSTGSGQAGRDLTCVSFARPARRNPFRSQEPWTGGIRP
jgi:uncharacterized protein (TIGR02265 family)